jgi:hypothetical protein
MPRHAACIGVLIGALLFMAALYGHFGETSGLVSVLGGVLLLAGAGALVVTQRPFVFKRPHVGTLVIAAAAAVLHAIECFGEGLSDAAVGFFVWGMTPYCLCLAISSLGRLRVAPVAGGVLALAADLLVHVEVFVAPQSSTSALLLIFVPLWSNLVIVPAGTIVAWLIARRVSGSSAPGPRQV